MNLEIHIITFCAVIVAIEPLRKLSLSAVNFYHRWKNSRAKRKAAQE